MWTGAHIDRFRAMGLFFYRRTPSFMLLAQLSTQPLREFDPPGTSLMAMLSATVPLGYNRQLTSVPH